jgi:A/G-specific adenine glycosylase
VSYEEFKELVWRQGNLLYRDMPWRRDTQPYYVLVSELMLQQTQVDRVIPKFEAFIRAFPTITVLADSSLADVLTLWSGLGYNRRAKFLHNAAKAVKEQFNGTIPSEIDDLVSLPGVGVNTAGAIRAYGFNLPTHFIETNVRTVYFYHFFPDQDAVSDKELKEVVAATADDEHPREWHWALMDYGAYLKKNGAGGLSKSKHYKKQSALKGSVREVRGAILRELTVSRQSIDELRHNLHADDRFTVALEGLLRDGLIVQDGDRLHLTE